MDITRFALDRRAVTFVLLLVLAFAGISSYNDMPKAEDPGFLIRIAVVMTQFPGASPDRVEQLVTDKLEKVIQEMPELDSIKSTSNVFRPVTTCRALAREPFPHQRRLMTSLRRLRRDRRATITMTARRWRSSDATRAVICVETVTASCISVARCVRITDRYAIFLLCILICWLSMVCRDGFCDRHFPSRFA